MASGRVPNMVRIFGIRFKFCCDVDLYYLSISKFLVKHLPEFRGSLGQSGGFVSRGVYNRQYAATVALNQWLLLLSLIHLITLAHQQSVFSGCDQVGAYHLFNHFIQCGGRLPPQFCFGFSGVAQ